MKFSKKFGLYQKLDSTGNLKKNWLLKGLINLDFQEILQFFCHLFYFDFFFQFVFIVNFKKYLISLILLL